jgi:hypothetical protein
MGEREAAEGRNRVRRRRGRCTPGQSGEGSPTAVDGGGRRAEGRGGGARAELGFCGEEEMTRLNGKGEERAGGRGVNPARGHAGPTGGRRSDAAAQPANGRERRREEDGGRG